MSCNCTKCSSEFFICSSELIHFTQLLIRWVSISHSFYIILLLDRNINFIFPKSDIFSFLHRFKILRRSQNRLFESRLWRELSVNSLLSKNCHGDCSLYGRIPVSSFKNIEEYNDKIGFKKYILFCTFYYILHINLLKLVYQLSTYYLIINIVMHDMKKINVFSLLWYVIVSWTGTDFF